MKITFLGTSHGVPSANRFCTCFMIESGNTYYVIDAGAPVVDQLLRHGKEIRDLRALFTTHIHGDHTAELPHLIDLMNWYYKDSSADFYITEQPLIDAIENLLLASNPMPVDKERIRMHVVDPAVAYEDENLKLRFIPTKHMQDEGHPTYAILVSEGDKKVLFSGDFSYKLKYDDIPAILKEEEIDAFICEMAHFGTAELAPYLETCRAKNVYFTHVFPLSKYNDIEAIKGKYPFGIHTPVDGDVIEI